LSFLFSLGKRVFIQSFWIYGIFGDFEGKMENQIIVKRYPYEEPYCIQIEFVVSNDKFRGSTDIYCDVQNLAEIGNALQEFPKKIDDEFVYEYGSEVKEDKFYRYFRLRVYLTDSLGHCAIQFYINKNMDEPEEGICQFSIKAEAFAVNRLGKLFEKFSKLKHLEFKWTPKGDEMFETHQIEEKLWQI
jgi:hypothetical protein